VGEVDEGGESDVRFEREPFVRDEHHTFHRESTQEGRDDGPGVAWVGEDGVEAKGRVGPPAEMPTKRTGSASRRETRRGKS
jgi:hypothetical protein